MSRHFCIIGKPVCARQISHSFCSLQVFFHLVLEKLNEMKIPFNLEQIITDFELNIHKSIDEMLPEIDILGCFFHLAKAFKKKVDKKEMKRHYDGNPEFQKFIKQAIGLSSLPLGDLEEGLKWLKDNVHFDDEKEESFKNLFLQYIDDYWVNGCFPPFVWSTWSRTGDFTNNNQEGYNSKMNRELKQQNPSPGILLCFLRKEIILAEHRSTEALVGDPGPRQQVKHRNMRNKRIKLKQNYEKAKKMKNVNVSKIIGEYLSIMGHNVISSTLVGSLTDQKESQNPNNVIEENADEISFWQAVDETIVEEMEEGENPYDGRKVGVSRRVQEREEERALQWWRNAICPSCQKGFNSKSSKKQCHSCDKYTHIKKKCLSTAEDNTVFLCNVCKPPEETPMANETERDKVDGFKCNQCEFKSTFKYNLSRHLLKQHGTLENVKLQEPMIIEEPVIFVSAPKSAKEDPPVTLKSMLSELGLSHFLENFESEGVDLKMLISLNKDDQKECFKEIGVKRFGDRHKLTERISIEKTKFDASHVPKETENPDGMDFMKGPQPQNDSEDDAPVLVNGDEIDGESIDETINDELENHEGEINDCVKPASL